MQAAYYKQCGVIRLHRWFTLNAFHAPGRMGLPIGNELRWDRPCNLDLVMLCARGILSKFGGFNKVKESARRLRRKQLFLNSFLLDTNLTQKMALSFTGCLIQVSHTMCTRERKSLHPEPTVVMSWERVSVSFPSQTKSRTLGDMIRAACKAAARLIVGTGSRGTLELKWESRQFLHTQRFKKSL